MSRKSGTSQPESEKAHLFGELFVCLAIGSGLASLAVNSVAPMVIAGVAAIMLLGIFNGLSR